MEGADKTYMNLTIPEIAKLYEDIKNQEFLPNKFYALVKNSLGKNLYQTDYPESYCNTINSNQGQVAIPFGKTNSEGKFDFKSIKFIFNK